ncbi:hypothetical protein BJY52DRAFT_1288580 [Lactarius psammicola]|nr:hypothetical protein BJY52DRAFT_1288580 [Lactarius psammicola]
MFQMPLFSILCYTVVTYTYAVCPWIFVDLLLRSYSNDLREIPVHSQRPCTTLFTSNTSHLPAVPLALSLPCWRSFGLVQISTAEVQPSLDTASPF